MRQSEVEFSRAELLYCGEGTVSRCVGHTEIQSLPIREGVRASERPLASPTSGSNEELQQQTDALGHAVAALRIYFQGHSWKGERWS